VQAGCAASARALLAAGCPVDEGSFHAAREPQVRFALQAAWAAADGAADRARTELARAAAAVEAEQRTAFLALSKADARTRVLPEPKLIASPSRRAL
jgi:hypothetical protein